jgi:hypothetical protein
VLFAAVVFAVSNRDVQANVAPLVCETSNGVELSDAL